MAVSDITTAVASLAPVNTNVPVPHTSARPSVTATKENQFPPTLSGFSSAEFLRESNHDEVPRNRAWWTGSTTVKYLSSLTARSQILHGPIISGKPKSRILKQMFRSSRDFRPPNHTGLEWNFWGNCWFYCDLGLFPLRKKRFVEWRLASDR